MFKNCCGSVHYDAKGILLQAGLEINFIYCILKSGRIYPGLHAICILENILAFYHTLTNLLYVLYSILFFRFCYLYQSPY